MREYIGCNPMRPLHPVPSSHGDILNMFLNYYKVTIHPRKHACTCCACYDHALITLAVILSRMHARCHALYYSRSQANIFTFSSARILVTQSDIHARYHARSHSMNHALKHGCTQNMRHNVSTLSRIFNVQS